MGPSAASAYIDKNLVEKELSEDELALRKEFVRLYMKTRSAYASCIALGFMEPYAQDWVRAFLGEGVVRRLIMEAEHKDDTPEGTDQRQKQYRAWMEQQATYYGPGASHGSRVAAIAHLMKAEGMEAPTRSETEVAFKGGVMVVPQLTTPGEWAKVAQQAQADLKANVKD